jgi:glutamyl-tRNA synthetase
MWRKMASCATGVIMKQQVRVRFAPSPTGYLHVGNVRTALFNWLFTRRQEGTFILRIEDTDAERSAQIYEKQILEDLHWLGLDWDEGIDKGGDYGPYRQTDRYAIYRSYAEKLLQADKAYYCFCTEEELEAERAAQLARGETIKYSGKCRALSRHEAETRLARGDKAVVRLKVRTGTVGFDDLVFGSITVDGYIIGDPVLLRSDATPNYNFSCVVDDHLMKISHVIRGDGHLSNTHRQILIYEALGLTPPRFAHLSTVLGNDGTKLSKRHGATSLEEFRKQGYLPEALVNYLALLGWAPKEEGKEILPATEIVKQFELEKVSKNPAIFDTDKLNWVNRSYVKAADLKRLVDLSRGYLVEAGLLPKETNAEIEAWLAMVLDAIKTHLDRLDQVVAESSIILEFDPASIRNHPDTADVLTSQPAKAVVRAFYEELARYDTITFEEYKAAAMKVKERTGQKGKNLFHPIRVALTARGSGPELDKLVPIFEKGKKLDLPVKIKGCVERLSDVLKMMDS